MSLPPEPSSDESPTTPSKSGGNPGQEEESGTRLFLLLLARMLAETSIFVVSLLVAIWAQVMLWLIVVPVFQDAPTLTGIVAITFSGVLGVLVLRRIAVVCVNVDRSRITSAGLQTAALMGCALSCLLMGICGGKVMVG